MNIKNILFTIVIPTYNYEKYVPDAIHSVLQQSFDDYQLIVINDGSTDNTDIIIKNILTDTNNKFEYYSRENKGVSATRNEGISLAKGDYIYFLDSDDKMLSNALETFANAILENPYAGMLIARYYSVHSNGEKKERCLWSLSESKEENFKKYLLEVNNSLLCSSIVFKKEVFDNYKFPEHLRLYEDEPVFSYILANFKTIKIDTPIALIQKHEDSLRHQVYNGLVEQSVDEIFSHSRIPTSLLKFKNKYLGLKYLDQFRTLYLAKQYEKAWKQFIQAFPYNIKTALKPNFLRKAIKSWLKK